MVPSLDFSENQEIKVTCFLGALVVDGASCTLLVFSVGRWIRAEASRPERIAKLTHIAMEHHLFFNR